MMANEQSLKRAFDETSPDAAEQIANIFRSKQTTTSPNAVDDINKSTLEDLSDEIFLEIFQYLHPMNLLYSFNNLFPRLDALIKPYTHTLDVRFINKTYFQCLTQSLLPYFIDDLRVLHLSNAYTFGQISDMFYKFDWTQINQIESLTLDSIQSEELSKYFVDIHSLLKHLWRLSLTFDEHDKPAEKLLIDHIFIHTNQSLTSCFITGITFNLNRLLTSQVNNNLRELTLTLSTINDLIILFRHLPHLENLICTILHSTSNESIDKISSLQFLTMLTIKIEESIAFKDLQKILVPHTKIKILSLKAILRNEDSSTNGIEEIGGFVLEKLFRTFSRLTELQFYLRQLQVTLNYHKSDESYLFSFTSHFWVDRSIKVFTHFIESRKQRYIYTLPFPFDKFDIIGDIDSFLHNPHPYCYANICHLSLSTAYIQHPLNDSFMISKYFPNIQTVTFSDKSTSSNTIKIVTDHQWILQRSGSETVLKEVYPCVYTRNSRKSKHWYFETLEVNSIDQRIFANTSKRVRQLTIYKMTEQQTVALTYFFPWIHVLILHVNTLEWLSASNDWLYQLLTNMTSLFSLTIHYPKNIKDQNIRDLLINTLFAAKKYFFFKCNDGIVNMWF